ncbi:two-component sensor histidine kinase [Xanthomonas campestris pv. badrii]|uniref:histidine kinase n=1 Tax=Xanthomonas campestris pv. badrii TaxID=149696 RepID=A0A7Z2VED1_XANCA|nr:ATP-binding protein [Xanthomonas campestris]QJD70099.1 two-component sensor histidine kinase [Xanthomonas campestris pv. badrii]
MLLALLGVLSLLMLAAAGFSYRAGLQEAGEMFDARLVQSARVLLSLVDEPLGDLPQGEPIVIHGWHGQAQGVGEALAFKDGHAYETKLAFQVRNAAGGLVLRSDSAPTQPLAPLRAGYADVQLADGQWRTFTLHSPGGRWFQSAERADIREELAEDIALGTLVPLLLSLPLMALLIWAVVNWATRSLVRVSDEIGERDPKRLQPLQPQHMPREVHGLVRAVNGLMDRVQDGLERERRFIADAAHELRTPIAALKVHAANLRLAADANERTESQQQLDANVARIERMVAQLLALSRVEAVAALPRRNVSLDALVRSESEDVLAVAAQRDQVVELDLQPTLVIADETALSLLLRNLLENAVRYTPPGGRIRISTDPDPSPTLVVEDSGPGIAEEARARVFHRFHRELGTGVEGSGLGLSIAQEIAVAHAARIQLDQAPTLGGLRVSVRFAANP